MQAMAWLCLARLLVGLVPFRVWRNSLGSRDRLAGVAPSAEPVDEGMRLSRRIERAMMHLPIQFKCLPQAMALSWMLRRQAIAHRLVIAARPAEARDAGDALHAWVEVDGEIVIGDLPGPWHKVFDSAVAQN